MLMCQKKKIVYGISGSNWRDEAMVQNERLLTMAVARCLSYGDEPYLLLGDFNVNERKSDIGFICQVLKPDKLVERQAS